MSNFLWSMLAICFIGSILISIVCILLKVPFLLHLLASIVWGFYVPTVTRKLLGKK